MNVSDFLANGGQITVVPAGKSGKQKRTKMYTLWHGQSESYAINYKGSYNEMMELICGEVYYECEIIEAPPSFKRK